MAERPSDTEELLSDIEPWLKCPVCVAFYTRPRALDCSHAICESCLGKVVSQDGLSVACPMCRRSTLLPQGGVTGLQPAFYTNFLFHLQQRIQKIKKPQRLTCDKCSETSQPVTSFCQQCAEFICESCSMTHRELDEFKGHKVKKMEKLEGDSVRLVSPKKGSVCCTKHGKDLKLYCESCNDLICIDCTVHIHEDHTYWLISDMVGSHKGEILVSMEPVKKQLEATNTALVRLDGRCDEIEAEVVTIVTKIHTAFDNFRKTLEAREAELVAQLEGHTQQQLKKLSTQREEVEILHTQCESCVNLTRENVRSRSPRDVLNIKAGLEKQMKELVDVFDPHTLELCEQATTSFIPSSQLIKDSQEFGALYTVVLKTVSKKRVKSMQSQIVATVQVSEQEVYPSVYIEAKLISRLTDQTTKCVVTKQGKGEYEISYQPRVGGSHQLHVRVGREEVRGSPFPVTVKIPVDKLGTIIKTFDCVKGPWGVAGNNSGEVIVAESKAGCVSIFSGAGNKLRTLHTQGTAVGGMMDPRGVAVDSEDNILVADASNHQLLKFSQGGDLIKAEGNKGDGPGQFMSPKGLCVNSVNGKVYVVNSGAHCVHICNSDLTFSSKFGSKGRGDGQFSCPWDIASDSTGCVYVTDYYNNRVQMFTSDGVYLRQFRNKGSGRELNDPLSICVDSDDLVYVGRTNCVSVITREGEFLKSFGLSGSGPGQSSCPIGIAMVGGVVYLSDYLTNRVQLF